MLKAAMRTLAAAATAATLACPAHAKPAEVKQGPDVSHFTLANGLEVVVIPDHRVPVVTHMIWYRVGAADEQPGKSGIAHFLEHLMFKGTKANPAGVFSAIVAEVGGQENAFTSNDYTSYFQRVARDELETMMRLEADRMTGLELTDAVVLPERDVVLEERRMRTDNDPAAQLGEEMAASMFRNHPYGVPVIGWEHEIKGLDRDDALAFYRRFYTPNNAILVVAGDVTADEVRTLAERTYGKIAPRAEVTPRVRPAEPPPRAGRLVTLADPRVAQPSIQRQYLVPSYSRAAPREAEALDLLAQVLGASQTSRLHRKLVVEKKLATSASAWYHGSAYDETRFGVWASPRPDVSLEDLEAAIDAVLAEVVETGISEDELARAKTRLVADTVYAQDSQTALARIYGVALTTGSSIEDVRAWPERVKAISAAEVQAAARKWLDMRRSVTGHLVKAPPAGEKRS
ncbi:peptidase M16 [Blastochloris tepida]|uniref:Peptidase M16 n=2 Tax=Blastochloris tepida TaxID=2233851 RepID=A0A348FVZ8_9HYPH|nr:pitrilysin family protein [Blastochloris tepida]BBF91481.1 peptidase M16 [Blastochloris tepida]